MTIVAAGALAADVFAALHAEAFSPAWSASAFHGMLLGWGAFGFIAMEGEGPRGMLVGSALGESAEILTIGVSPQARGRELGAALVNAALDEVRGRGAEFLLLEVAEDNLAGRALYTKLGFEQIGVRRSYYQAGAGPARDALVLRRSANL